MAKEEFCSVQTYGGTLETPPEYCEDEAIVWDADGIGYCHRHRAGADDGPDPDQEWYDRMPADWDAGV